MQFIYKRPKEVNGLIIDTLGKFFEINVSFLSYVDFVSS